MEIFKNVLGINGVNINVEYGHTKEEWLKKYGDNADLWNIDFGDFLNDALDPDPSITYWYIDGRMFETA